jgi:L-fuconolactonase
MIGSDWPVCVLAGSYKQIMQVVLDYVLTFPDRDKKKILGENAIKAYDIKL